MFSPKPRGLVKFADPQESTVNISTSSPLTQQPYVLTFSMPGLGNKCLGLWEELDPAMAPGSHRLVSKGEQSSVSSAMTETPAAEPGGLAKEGVARSAEQLRNALRLNAQPRPE